MVDTTVKKIDSFHSPRGAMGQKYLVSGKAVSMRLREREAPTHEPGDSWLVPKGADHAYRILEEFTAVEATSPPVEIHGRDER